MVVARTSRSNKRQLGQFLTPQPLAEQIVAKINIQPHHRVLEPGCGNGSFLLPIIHRFLALGLKFDDIMRDHVWAVELDPEMYKECLARIEKEFGKPHIHNIRQDDFLLADLPVKFHHVVGNPPFGGTINTKHQDELDKKYGKRNGIKIKKETYSFFMVKCIDNHLLDDGNLTFISSDTFKTLPTFLGLRKHLMIQGSVSLDTIKDFSDETNYPMVLLSFHKGQQSVTVNDQPINKEDIESTPNFSWSPVYPHLFKNKIGDYMICSSGMTTGKNEFFLRDIDNNKITETYRFDYFDDPITLKRELERARLNKLSQEKQDEIKQLEEHKTTRRNVRITPCEPYEIQLPHPDYKYYNKANSDIVLVKPRWAIYWKDNGDAVRTFKKNGNWYLHGVGGMPFFEREGLTWNLVSSRLKMKYLPSGYILDSGAPCAFLRPGIDPNELYFILGWCLTDDATKILKTVLNHTQNIQSKDIERMPYPTWVVEKQQCIELVKNLVEEARYNNIELNHPTIKRLNELYARQCP